MYEYRGGSPAYKSDYTDYNVNKKPVTNSEYGTVKGGEYSTVAKSDFSGNIIDCFSRGTVEGQGSEFVYYRNNSESLTATDRAKFTGRRLEELRGGQEARWASGFGSCT